MSFFYTPKYIKKRLKEYIGGPNPFKPFKRVRQPWNWNSSNNNYSPSPSPRRKSPSPSPRRRKSKSPSPARKKISRRRSA